MILFIYRDEVYTKEACERPGIAEVIIGKNRHGPIGHVDLKFIGRHTRFESLSPRDEDPGAFDEGPPPAAEPSPGGAPF